MEKGRPYEISKNDASVAASTMRAVEAVIRNLATLYRRLQEDEIMEDPRVKDELREIIKLKDASTVRFKDVEIIRSKNARDGANKIREIDTVVLTMRKYRVYLNDITAKGVAVKVNADVVSEAERMLVELEKHTRRCKERNQKVLSENAPKTKTPESKSPEIMTPETKAIEIKAPESKTQDSNNPDDKVETEEVISEEEPLDEIYEAYETPQEGKGEQELAEEFPVHRERSIQATLERLEHYIEGLGEDSLLLEVIQYQMNRILRVVDGKPENEWEIYCVKTDVDRGHGGSFEESLLYGLKQFRVFLYYYSRHTSEIDTMLIEKILEAKQLMAALGIGLTDESEDEEGRDIYERESEDGSERGIEFEGEHVLTNGDCSCGTFCSLALARPITPEGELPTEEREMQEWYEENQEIHKRHVTSLADFLGPCTKDALAGKTIDSNILLCAKKVRDLDRGTMKEFEGEFDEALEAVYDEVIDQSFVQQIINYYYQARHPNSLFQLDEEVVKACNALLATVSEESEETVGLEVVEEEDGEEENETVLGPT